MSSSSLSSGDAPSDEERFVKRKRLAHNVRYKHQQRNASASAKNSIMDRDPNSNSLISTEIQFTQKQHPHHSLWSVPLPLPSSSKSESIYIPSSYNKNNVVCRIKPTTFYGSRSIDDIHHHEAGSLHTSPYRISSKNNDDEELCAHANKFFPLKTSVMSIRRQYYSLRFFKKLSFLFVVCFLCLSVVISPFESDKENTRSSHVAYSVEHGREIEFPPKFRSPESRTSILDQSGNGEQSSFTPKTLTRLDDASNTLLQESTKQVSDAPKYIPKQIQGTIVSKRSQRKPIIAYAKMSAHNPPPKFIRSDHIEKFIPKKTQSVEEKNDIGIIDEVHNMWDTSSGNGFGSIAFIILPLVAFYGIRKRMRRIALIETRLTVNV